jgi:Outer membrane protein beta-barrel family/CarboxypepD_reg-like domain
MKRFTTLLLLLFFFTQIFSQSIKGTITDTLKSPLISATVLLLDRDSTLLEFTQTDNNGNFIFKRISKGDYLIKTTYVGYIPQTLPITIDKSDIDLGNIKMNEISIELYEVVIKAARAPMKIKGDTIEYDASTFKVPVGSTLEDLLRRLPGVEVQQDGTLKADGQDVTKLTVEGKSFFGGDPKTATKNLPAEGVSKVQVFDKKTEEQKITGEKSTTKEKEMNITLKDEFKKGGFGKIIAGAGSVNRYELKGNYNRFNDKHQFSVVGVGNNTGRNGLGWDDYQDFMGSQSFSFSDDNLEYGFSGGGMRYYSFGGNNDGLESSISNSFFSGGNNNGGFPKSKNGGINYNYDHNKIKIGARYFYNNNRNDKTTTEESTTFFPTKTNYKNKISDIFSSFDGHRGELNYEHELDSFNTILFTGSLANAISSNTNRVDEQNSENRSRLLNQASINNGKSFDGNLYNGTFIYRKTFKKKGRFFGVNAAYTKTSVGETNPTSTQLEYYGENTVLDSTRSTVFFNDHIANKDAYKFNATINEPLSKIFFASIFYNYSKKIQDGNILVEKPGFELQRIQVKDLTRDYTNDVFYNRIGSSLRYAKNGVNISIGAAYLGYKINSTIIQASNPSTPVYVKNPYNTIVPNGGISVDIGKNGYVSLNYGKDIQEPNINQLIPIVDNRNPFAVTEGNPSLQPSNSDRISFYASRSWPADGIRLNGNLSFTNYNTSIINDVKVDVNQLSYSRPVNYNDGQDLYSYMSVSLPIIKNRIKTNVSYTITTNKSFAIVNDVLNETKSNGNSPRLTIDITPSDKIGLYLTGSYRRRDVKYNINTSQNQIIKNTNISGQFNLNLGKGLFASTNYSHSFYASSKFGGNTNIPILDASVYFQFLKGKKGEVRFSLYDAFNKNRNFIQYAGGNIVSVSNTPSLARYFLVSFTYNLRGMVGTVEKVW